MQRRIAPARSLGAVMIVASMVATGAAVITWVAPRDSSRPTDPGGSGGVRALGTIEAAPDPASGPTAPASPVTEEQDGPTGTASPGTGPTGNSTIPPGGGQGTRTGAGSEPTEAATGGGTGPDPTGGAAVAGGHLAPLHLAPRTAVVTGTYLVVLRGDHTSTAERSAAIMRAEGVGAVVERRFSHALVGYTAWMDAASLAAVRADRSVAYVEQDARVHVAATERSAPWNLDRIDQRASSLDGTYRYAPTGSGVTAYVIDTGVRSTHHQFGGRVGTGYSAIGGSTEDCDGHGTHVAGTIGGSTLGVAKAVTIVPVRVLDCQGSGDISGVVAGIDWVTAHHSTPAVANLSLEGSSSTALDSAVQNAVAAGVTVVVAAGNSDVDACETSPAEVPQAITVGAVTYTDSRDTDYSNYGSCLDLFAPGTDVLSSWYTSDTALAVLSGTSMASPHVAGVAALYLQQHPTASPSTVTAAILATSTTGAVAQRGTGSPDRLLFSGLTHPRTATPTCAHTATTPETASGSITSVGATLTLPEVGFYVATAAGPHVGCLTGANGTDFDLYLDRWNGLSWTTVARGETTSSAEHVAYTGPAGAYRWRVVGSGGSGSFTLRSAVP